MANWQIEKFHRTLYILRVPASEGKTLYRIYPMMTVRHKDTGEQYVEFVPTRNLTSGYSDVFNFDAVEFIDQPATARKDTASLLELHANKVTA